MTWLLTILFLSTSAPAEERLYRGFATEDECLRALSLKSADVANWGSIGGDVAAAAPSVVAVCSPDLAPSVPAADLARWQRCAVRADANCDGTTTALEMQGALAAYQGKPLP